MLLSAPFQRSDFRQTADGFLGGGVTAPLGLAAGARARAEVDDRTTTGRDHQRVHGLHQQETGPRPDLVTQREVFAGDVDERLGLVGGDGVVDQTVHRAESIDGRGNDPLGAVRIAQVGDELLDAPNCPKLVGGGAPASRR